MARFFPFPVFVCLKPPAAERHVISSPSPVAASEVRQFLAILRHGKTQNESGIRPVAPHTVLPQHPAFSVPAQTFPHCGNTGFMPGREEKPHAHNLPVNRNDTPEKNNDIKSTVTDVPAEISPEHVPHTVTEKMAAHLETRQTSIITRITDTLVTRITHISRQTETLTTCRATFPALGDISFTIRHRTEGIQIQICCPPGSAAFLQSCLPRLQEQLMQKIPQPFTLLLTGSGSAVRRK